MPSSLNEAIATEPLWLQAWVMLLAGTHTLSVLFIGRRDDEGWRLRGEPVAILVSFVTASAAMSWLFAEIGYVRLLGIAHIVCWTPAYVWVFSRRKTIGTHTFFGKYILLYLVVAGMSLVIDVIDTVRYLLGDGELLHRAPCVGPALGH